MVPKDVLEWFYEWSVPMLSGTENEDKLVMLATIIDSVEHPDEEKISNMAWGDGTKFVKDTNPTAKTVAVTAYSQGARDYVNEIFKTSIQTKEEAIKRLTVAGILTKDGKINPAYKGLSAYFDQQKQQTVSK